MTMNEIKDILLWCLGFNYVILIIWFVGFVLAHDWMYSLHGRWFKLSVETFDAIHYSGFAAFKIGIFMFNLAPLIAIYIVSR
jgi:hypothetical protein